MASDVNSNRPPYQRYPAERQNSSPFLMVVAVIALILAAVSFLWQFWPSAEDNVPGQNQKAQLREVTPRGELWPEEKAVIQLYSESRKSVVHIHTIGLQRDPFTLNVERVPRGTGTGFIWNKEGHIVTNSHVALPNDENPQTIQYQVTTYDQKQHTATLVGAYPEKDIAVLVLKEPKEEVAKLRPIPLGNSHNLQVGQSAFAIGNPFGLDQTLTEGLISALGREIQTRKDRPPIRNVIQTDAAINPGNSGGPLLDTAGRLIGVNTAIYSPSGASAGIGFAIPVDEINHVVTQLIRAGRVPSLGIEPVPRDEITRRVHPTGVMIHSVISGGPAEQAGLKGVRPVFKRVDRGFLGVQEEFAGYVYGDVIIKIDNKKLGSIKDYYEIMEKQRVGSTVTVVVVREGKEKLVQVQL